MDFSLEDMDLSGCGLDVGENYNLSKSENARQPQCTPEKEEAIMQAFKHFGMI